MHTRRFTAASVSSLILISSVLLPGGSQAAGQDVVRIGDRQMSCTALAAEINMLAQPASGQPASKPAKKRGFGFLKVLGSAVPFVGMAGGMGGAMLSSAASVAQTAGAGNQATDTAEQSSRMMQEALGGSPGQQRKERLTTIFEEKRC